mmetsp:Transcript_19401/g.54495  ORF Transcript_19401/g.54495 Transcript_19401/m.54495 type:complete len:248 (+) Transcript_19401:1015-1758(+)
MAYCSLICSLLPPCDSRFRAGRGRTEWWRASSGSPWCRKWRARQTRRSYFPNIRSGASGCFFPRSGSRRCRPPMLRSSRARLSALRRTAFALPSGGTCGVTTREFERRTARISRLISWCWPPGSAQRPFSGAWRCTTVTGKRSTPPYGRTGRTPRTAEFTSSDSQTSSCCTVPIQTSTTPPSSASSRPRRRIAWTQSASAWSAERTWWWSPSRSTTPRTPPSSRASRNLSSTRAASPGTCPRRRAVS